MSRSDSYWSTKPTCRECGGRGWVTEPGPEYNLPNKIVCDRCGGRGYEPSESNWSKKP